MYVCADIHRAVCKTWWHIALVTARATNRMHSSLFLLRNVLKVKNFDDIVKWIQCIEI